MKNENYSEANYEYNVARVHQHGFPDTQDKSIQEQMKDGVSRILQEYHSSEYAGNVMGIVHIEKNANGDYFPNRLQLRLQPPNSDYYKQQYFPITNSKEAGKQFDITRTMGVNLLRGASVLKSWMNEDGRSVNEWRALDFKDKTVAGHAYLSFDREALDVVKKLGELPIQEKNPNDPRRTAVILSIEAGNSQAVHLDAPGSPVISLRANPSKGEFDIIKGGHMISMEQLNTELAGIRGQGQDKPGQTIGGKPSTTAGPADDQEQGQSASRKQGPVNNIGIISGIDTPGQKETWVDPSNTNRIKDVLKGNQVTPSRSNARGHSNGQSL